MAPQSSASAPITVHENAPGEAMAVREFEAKATSFVKAMLSLEKRYVHQSLKTNFAMEIQSASFSFFPIHSRIKIAIALQPRRKSTSSIASGEGV